MRMKSCVVCGKNTEVKTGWHLKYGLDFCGNACVAKYLETSHKDILRLIRTHEQRIRKLEGGGE